MKAIYFKELTYFFKTPLGYVYLGLNLFIIGLLFTLQNLFAMSSNFTNFLGPAQIVFFFTSPLLTMRLYTEERRAKTDQLLLTSPITPLEIMLGKVLAAATMFGLTLLMVLFYLLILNIFGWPDLGLAAGALVGYILLSLSFISLGLYVSTIVDSQMSAATLTVGLIFSFWIMANLIPIIPTTVNFSFGAFGVITLLFSWRLWRKSANARLTILVAVGLLLVIGLLYLILNEGFVRLIPNMMLALSLSSRYDNFLRGVIRLSDVVFYLSFSAFFVYLAAWRLEEGRYA
ncbi:MAG: ABC transporter permease [Spirochaetaceae bacterium]|nr:ABC transporter permease [Spirochaetaceae bacterium]